MALESYAATLNEWENIIRVNMRVTNPTLLKSGALGILANFLAGIKYDALQFYSKTFQEMNVGLAQDFNSMLYHSTVYGAEIEFANPATLSSSLIVPEIQVQQIEELVYEIPRFKTFSDTNGISFTFVSDIKIVVTKGTITATAWNESGSRNLTVTKAANPNIPGSYVYLIHNAEAQQYKREFHSFIVPEYGVGESYIFSVGVGDIRTLKDLKAWLNIGDPVDDLNRIDKLGPEDITALNLDPNNNYNFIPMNIKYHKFDSSIRENNLFATLYEASIQFETGNGFNGLIPPPNSQIIVGTETSLGEQGNIQNAEFLVTDVFVKELYNGSAIYNSYTTTINGVSTAGAAGGYSVPGVDQIRESIFDRISVRESIITENDYERLFEYQRIRPFVDAKFIDAKAFVFLFNVIHENDQVIKTNTFNIKEAELIQEPFYPELTYNGITLVSPFYYKNKDENQIEGYMVNPEVVFSLQPDITSPDYINENNYRAKIVLSYDFGMRKSYIGITDGAMDNYQYEFKAETSSGVINIILNKNNDFKQEINETYTDPYCIIRDMWTNIVVTVSTVDYNALTYVPELKMIYRTPSGEAYTQLHLKQTFYKYFQDLPEDAAPVYDDLFNTGYLDNNINNIMSTINDVFEMSVPYQTEPVVLRLPFIDKDYYYSKPPSDVFEMMDQYFIVDYLEDSINYNTQLTQAFHNTIDIPAVYYSYLFEENTMPQLPTPKIPIKLQLYLDSDAFLTSKYGNMTDFEVAVRITIIKFLKKNEGFTIEFFETDLEKELYNQFNPIIRNVRVESPSLFRVNNSSVIYEKIQKELEFQEVLDFIPPYFYYDYDNIELTIDM